jgi:hypothetical protein
MVGVAADLSAAWRWRSRGGRLIVRPQAYGDGELRIAAHGDAVAGKRGWHIIRRRLIVRHGQRAMSADNIEI